MSKAHDEFFEAFNKLLDEVGVAGAMVVATGMFVSLVTGYLEQQGADTDKSITIDGGENRDITIHPTKRTQDASHEQG